MTRTQELIEKMLIKIKPILEADIHCKYCKHSGEIAPDKYICYKYQKVVNWDEHKECFECYVR